ncbi:hypothetical protein [Mucilaginibacter sp.]|uniref:hypothetical protein n=1 Tax=Mucilaginibacter sp. TaxID=1882438 RepID=UPI00283EC528|nr:hypothetical protein [Mucilaginibacter sp.]MDR3696022.1 hypothetical protein [Mucilaginibacter sp.]
MNLSIIDDDGFIAIVNSDNYQSFVDHDWQFDQLMAHFVDQMNAGNIVIWQTSNDGGGIWVVAIRNQPSNTLAFRQFEHFINVTNGELFLTNYSDLTMAAQFSDASVPSRHNADLNIAMENGVYKVTVRQLFDPDNVLQYSDTETDENISFEIIIAPSRELVRQQVNSVYWHEF